MSEEIAAPPARVWRTLCDPAEVAGWDAGVAQALDAPADYPRPGQHVRWRTRQGLFRILHDRPLEVQPERLLRASLALGPSRIDETYRLEGRPGGSRLTADLTVRVAIPIVGPLLARWWIGPRIHTDVAASLLALREWCEANRRASP